MSRSSTCYHSQDFLLKNMMLWNHLFNYDNGSSNISNDNTIDNSIDNSSDSNDNVE
jgi:hypothetical protein